MGVGDIIVVDQLFANFEVYAFDFLLGVLDGFDEYGVLNWDVLFPLEHFEGAFDAVAAEASYEVVFDGEEELGFARVALSCTTPPQLVVDASRFVAFRTKDEEATFIYNAVVLPLP